LFLTRSRDGVDPDTEEERLREGEGLLFNKSVVIRTSLQELVITLLSILKYPNNIDIPYFLIHRYSHFGIHFVESKILKNDRNSGSFFYIAY